MKNLGYLLLGGAAVALGVGAVLGFRRQRRPSQPLGRPRGRMVELNQGSIEEFVDIGLDQQSIDRMIEERPYRNKLELISRMIIPEETYEIIRNKIYIAAADEPVKVAS